MILQKFENKAYNYNKTRPIKLKLSQFSHFGDLPLIYKIVTGNITVIMNLVKLRNFANITVILPRTLSFNIR